MTDKQTIWITQDAYDKLSEELDHLKDEGRTEIAGKIGAAKAEGDLSENGGYHAAREEQGQMEARIRQLEQMLQNAEVGVAQAAPEKVVAGTTVTIAYDGDPDDTDVFLLGSREMLGLDDSLDTQVYSPQSPLGAAVLDHAAGDEVSYETPNGKTVNVMIVKIESRA
ncbi:transcription elongation factor GreA [Propionibacterium australiense]|uniref:Transcription elongation factor GreA n=1 Tax=Propionibacterium australiense TaxID=119981 RepID=A0A383SAF6_9ACTN|nr:transcription elongation factor GreA [Propionibacterium australiense]RLP09558.1 transcription elongation factor GreA [Propionibacterium australiense]RLP09865.1 transcription elongation factor GreA [Propionibacterium australiense]SYZ34206.1 greA: transcription elongation factor GreA [Propionibacterium australiense]VEH89471.1 Transcript cleavage factor greA [Propionibacterium australiense]